MMLHSDLIYLQTAVGVAVMKMMREESVAVVVRGYRNNLHGIGASDTRVARLDGLYKWLHVFVVTIEDIENYE